MPAANRANRDVSRVATRVRLTRRELSPPVRRMEASAAEHAAVAAALERRVARLTEELASAQDTMAALRDVTAKQFEALAGAVTDLKRARSEAEIEASAARRAAAEAAAEAAAATAESTTKPTLPSPVDPSTESASSRGPASTPPPASIRAQKSRKPWSGPGFPGAVELAARQAAAKDAEISTSDRPRSDVSTTGSDDSVASDDSIASDDSTASDDSIASAPNRRPSPWTLKWPMATARMCTRATARTAASGRRRRGCSGGAASVVDVSSAGRGRGGEAETLGGRREVEGDAARRWAPGGWRGGRGRESVG